MRVHAGARVLADGPDHGQEVGTLALTVDGKPYGQYPVLALQDVPVAGFFGRLWDAIVMFFKSL